MTVTSTISTPATTNQAAHLIEALPYIRKFHGKTIVVKCGGAAMTALDDLNNMLQDLALLNFCGIRPIIVHGGGPEISNLAAQFNLPTQFIQGQRVTDAATLDIVQMALLGKVNHVLVNKLNQHGVKAVGISGHDGHFLQARKPGTGADLGYVGYITAIDTTLIQTLQNSGFIPVIAPIAVDTEGQAYNINGDLAAAAIASHLKAEKLIMLSDVNGLYADINDPATQINHLTVSEAKTLLRAEQIVGGMRPKLEACLQAIEAGVGAAHLLSGKLNHSILLEMLTNHGVGTMMTL